MFINCDIGERGAHHPIDIELMQYINIANIACGGHAGDQESVNNFLELARKNNVHVTAHLSYPDKDNFGRKSIELPVNKLYEALDEQLSLMSQVKWVKLHGALYNDTCKDSSLASQVAQWLKKSGIESVLTMPNSFFEEECQKLGIRVLSESFAERRYYKNSDKQLQLVPRNKPFASIENLQEALKQCSNIIKNQSIEFIENIDSKDIKYSTSPLISDTICIHSDSMIALELAKGIKKI